MTIARQGNTLFTTELPLAIEGSGSTFGTERFQHLFGKTSSGQTLPRRSLQVWLQRYYLRGPCHRKSSRTSKTQVTRGSTGIRKNSHSMSIYHRRKDAGLLLSASINFYSSSRDGGGCRFNTTGTALSDAALSAFQSNLHNPSSPCGVAQNDLPTLPSSLSPDHMRILPQKLKPLVV